MKEFLFKNKASNILMLLIVIMVFFVFWSSVVFKKSEIKIKKNLMNYQKKEISLFLKNISSYIHIKYGDNLSEILKNPHIRKDLALFLHTFMTTKMNNIFLVYKKPDEKFFRVLVDGSLNKNNDFKFNEEFDPINLDIWNKAYYKGKPVLIKHKGKGFVTFLYPVSEKKNRKFIIVVDFSITPIHIIDNNLKSLKHNMSVVLIMMMIAAVILVYFLFYDYKRQKEMEKLIKELQEFNDSLEDKVKEEIEKNREKEKQLILQSRMASMGELLSMIAHQWRQPLNVMSLMVSKIKLDLKLGVLDDENIEKTAVKLEDLIKHLSHTIDDFRKFYRNEEKTTDADIKNLIDELLSIANPSIKNNFIKISVEINCNSKIKTYPNELKQVLLNILKNAEDILIERKVENPEIKINVFEMQNKCIIEISDNAGGVSDAIKDKIFNPYFTTKNERNGTGLGLYMSKQIVEERLKGKIILKNSSKGAVFRLEIKSLKD